jgi:hypothetical protein
MITARETWMKIVINLCTPSSSSRCSAPEQVQRNLLLACKADDQEIVLVFVLPCPRRSGSPPYRCNMANRQLLVDSVCK